MPNRKLIEVALPLEAINDASAYDKMPGIGPHPKGIHHWWARLPLPSARAVLFASLVDDPSCDPRFVAQPEETQDAERERLFGIMRSLMQKKPNKHPESLEAAHREIVRSCEGKLPTLLDPFCGGGSIPIEGQRLGLHSQGSDLNPVAVLITKAAVEIIPRFSTQRPVNPEDRERRLDVSDWSHGRGLADDIRYYGQWIANNLESRIRRFYPKVNLPKEYGSGSDEAIAWIWARTAKCPNPACGAGVPLVRSFLLANKKDKQIWLEPIVDHSSQMPVVQFEVKTGRGKPRPGTITCRGATCLYCGAPVQFDYIAGEGSAHRLGETLVAIVTEGAHGRLYVEPDDQQVAAATATTPGWAPETSLPDQALGFRVQRYGMKTHSSLFTQRQLLALGTLSDLVLDVREQILADAHQSGFWDDSENSPLSQGSKGLSDYADAVVTFLAFAQDRCADFNNGLCRWSASNEKVMNLFGRQAIPMVWDHAEANILAGAVGGWITCANYVADCVETVVLATEEPGCVEQRDVTETSGLPASLIVSTDPPYYDNISYSDLSDFFYVWLRRTLGNIYPNLCSTILVPKTRELIAAPERFGNDKDQAKEHFESGFRRAFSAIRERLDPGFRLTVYYAFKQADEEVDEPSDDDAPSAVTLTTGWETLLEALIRSGFQITATWPVRASQAWRMRSMGSNALASYIVLACRSRSDSAPLAARRDFLASLKRELPVAIRRLQRGNIAPVDLAQASIGPGMAIYSRYHRVLEADGSAMTVRTALALINQALDAYLAEQEGEYDADTRWALAWFEQFGFEEGPFGDAETLSKAKNTSVGGMVEAGILAARGQSPPAPPRRAAGRLGSRRRSATHRLGGGPAAHPRDAGARRAGRGRAAGEGWRPGRHCPRPGVPTVHDLRAEGLGAGGAAVQRAGGRVE